MYILTKARELLSQYNIRLHKIICNTREVLEAFPQSECSINLAELDIQHSEVQRTLGVAWDTIEDVFVMRVRIPDRPFTKRGVISVINTIYDPL